VNHNPIPDQLIRDAVAFWALVKAKDGRAIFQAPSQNSVVQLLRYGIVGGSTFLVDFLLLFFLTRAGVYYLPASACSFLVGICCNFVLTKRFAFKAVDPTMGPTAEVAVFAAISAGGLVLTTLLMGLFRGHLGLPVMGAKVLSSLLVFLWNFLGRKLILYPGQKHKHT
jgi:putative flippase GtrA